MLTSGGSTVGVAAGLQYTLGSSWYVTLCVGLASSGHERKSGQARLVRKDLRDLRGVIRKSKQVCGSVYKGCEMDSRAGVAVERNAASKKRNYSYEVMLRGRQGADRLGIRFAMWQSWTSQRENFVPNQTAATALASDG